jgi:UDP-N-acetylmuramyl pentapeptide phosphotransferase/UDP-N-acetylglucosamine-1-phosphate transferase
MIKDLTLFFFIFLFFCQFLSFIFKKNLVLVDQKILPHKLLTSDKAVPLIGGVLILVVTLFYLPSSFLLKISFILIFFIGFFSDIFLLKKPSSKFLLQLLVIFFTIFYTSDLRVIVTKIPYLDYLLKTELINIFFTLFCFLILINGSNFIDGLNTLCCGYYLLIISIIFYIQSKNLITIDTISYSYLLLALLIIYFYNFFSKIYLGDSGSFLISFIVGIFLINITNNNKLISPIFIVLLLWYPAFENLFSIIRKLFFKINPSIPDSKHLHQLIFINLKKNINNKFLANTLSANLINFYNLSIFFFGAEFFYHTKYLTILIFINIFVYLVLYLFLYKKNY